MQYEKIYEDYSDGVWDWIDYLIAILKEDDSKILKIKGELDNILYNTFHDIIPIELATERTEHGKPYCVNSWKDEEEQEWCWDTYTYYIFDELFDCTHLIIDVLESAQFDSEKEVFNIKESDLCF